MRKKSAPVPRKARTRRAAGDPARERRADIAYRTYVLKALRRFDLEGRSETTRQPRERMLPFLALAPRVAPDDVRGILEREQAYQTELAMALGAVAPDLPDRIIRPNGGSAKRSSEH